MFNFKMNKQMNEQNFNHKPFEQNNEFKHEPSSLLGDKYGR